jgi:hypothetical protein
MSLKATNTLYRSEACQLATNHGGKITRSSSRTQSNSCRNSRVALENFMAATLLLGQFCTLLRIQYQSKKRRGRRINIPMTNTTQKKRSGSQHWERNSSKLPIKGPRMIAKNLLQVSSLRFLDTGQAVQISYMKLRYRSMTGQVGAALTPEC